MHVHISKDVCIYIYTNYFARSVSLPHTASQEDSSSSMAIAFLPVVSAATDNVPVANTILKGINTFQSKKVCTEAMHITISMIILYVLTLYCDITIDDFRVI